MPVRDTESLIESLAADFRPVPPLDRRRGLGAVGLALVATLGVAALVGLRPDLLTLALPAIDLISAGLFLLLALACATAALAMAQPQVGSRHDGWLWSLATTLLLPGTAIVLLLAGQDHFHAHDPQKALGCTAASMGFGLLTGFVLLRRVRRGAPVHAGRAGLVIGLAAGAAGCFAFGLVCPIPGPVHIGIAHVPAVLLSGLVGRLLLPPLLRW